jgi:predicted dehydrogenase
MAKIKIGIIGTGSISEQHIESYLNNSKVELYAFCDLNEERLKLMAEKYNIKHTFTDMNEMLRLKEIDAVSVCTWNSAHAPCTIAALNAGKHVLCEKPMSVSEEDAKAMKDAADKNGKLLMIGFVRRYGNDCNIVKEFINSDYFGEIYYAKATYLRRKGNPGGWFGEKARSGGGPLIDLGVHVIDLVRYLLGNPKPVSVYGATFKKLEDRKNIKGKQSYTSSSTSVNNICDVEDLATAMIRFDNGAVLSIEASFSLNIKKDEGKIELFGTKGGAKLDPELELYSEINDYLADTTLDAETSLSFDGLFANEINHFVSCITDAVPCLSPAQDGIEIMAILDAIYKSAETGHEVILSDTAANEF